MEPTYSICSSVYVSVGWILLYTVTARCRVHLICSRNPKWVRWVIDTSVATAIDYSFKLEQSYTDNFVFLDDQMFLSPETLALVENPSSLDIFA
jgi:hypothetical protein